MRKSGVAKKRAQPRRRAIVLVAPDGEVRYADAPAQRWLKDFFGRSARRRMLPGKVRRWLLEDTGQFPHHALVGHKRKAQLHIRRHNSLSEHSRVLLLELIKSKTSERHRRRQNLTAREREVLFWLTRGKSNSVIATILGTATGTVSKHLERIYAKLGVENRTAAAMYGLEHSKGTVEDD